MTVDLPKRKSVIAPWKFVLIASCCVGTVIFVAVSCFAFMEMKAQSENQWLETHVMEANEWVYALAYSPDGKTLASSGNAATVQLWDTEKHTIKKSLIGHRDSVVAVSISSDGQLLASGSDDTTIILWNLATAEKIASLKKHKGSLISLVFSPDGKFLVSSDDQNAVLIWDVATEKVVRTITHTTPVGAMSLSISPDSATLATAAGDVKLWNIETGKELASLGYHSNPVTHVAFSNDGSMIVTAASDGRITIRDARKHTVIQTFGDVPSTIMSVAFSPDDRMLACGTANDLDVSLFQMIMRELFGGGGVEFQGSVILWDVATGNQVAMANRHYDWVRSVVFSPDGKQLASGSDDNTIKIWNVPTSINDGK